MASRSSKIAEESSSNILSAARANTRPTRRQSRDGLDNDTKTVRSNLSIRTRGRFDLVSSFQPCLELPSWPQKKRSKDERSYYDLVNGSDIHDKESDEWLIATVEEEKVVGQ